MTIQQVLALDIAGTPVEWLSPEEAVTLYARNKVGWELGETEKVFRGGYSRFGIQSEIAIRPIIAIAGSEVMARMLRPELPLGDRDNSLLFRRDRNTCAYCGLIFARHQLTRDHIHPQSRGGKTSWQNCAAACRECNGRKGDRLLSDCGMELVYLPYVPSRAEHFILSGRNILADQHEYLAANLPRHSRVRLQ